MINKEEKRRDGFKDEQYFIIPTECFNGFSQHPMVKSLYLTDVGFFPNARNHYREREEGTEEHILICCVDGEGTIFLEDTEYKISSKEAFCIPAGVPHKYYASDKKPWSIFWVHFKGENVQYFPCGNREVIHISSIWSENRIITLFDVLFQVLEKNYTLGNFIYISQVLSLILSEIYFREKEDEVTKQNRQMTAIIRYMYKNIRKNLTLEDLSRELNLSKSYINATFKKYADRAPIDFFINLKMQEACKMLKATDFYVAEIARELGYEDPYYFSRIFKKTIGVSPKEYRAGDYVQKQEGLL